MSEQQTTYLQRWAEEDRMKNEKRKVRRPQLLAVLSKYGVLRAEVDFDGSGDSGQVEDIRTEGVDAEQTVITPEEGALFATGNPDNPSCGYHDDGPKKLNDFIERFAYEVLDVDCDGYENNDGGFGTVTIVPPTGEIKVELNVRFTDSELQEYDYSTGTTDA